MDSDITITALSPPERKMWLSFMVGTINWCGVARSDWDRWLVDWICCDAVYWSLVRLPEPIDPRCGEIYRRLHGEWGHRDGLTAHHNYLGMSFAGWAILQGCFDEIRLGDSPDVFAKKDGHLVMGDIGRCTIAAFIDGIQGLKRGDVWISVIDSQTQIALEFGYSPGLLRAITAFRGIDLHETPISRGVLARALGRSLDSVSQTEINRLENALGIKVDAPRKHFSKSFDNAMGDYSALRKYIKRLWKSSRKGAINRPDAVRALDGYSDLRNAWRCFDLVNLMPPRIQDSA